MATLLDVAYSLALLLFSPWLLYNSLTTGRYRRGLFSKFTGRAFLRLGSAPCVWFHGVSVGEIHLLRPVVTAFRKRHPECDCVVSSTTDTGFDEARKHFADLSVISWPLDFTWAVRRALKQIRPCLVVLAEGEVWPNFLSAAKKFGARVAVINGRMSPRSFRRYQKVPWLARRLFGRLDLCAAQNEEYAECFRRLGVADVKATGSVKFDGVATDRDNPRTQELRQLLAVEAKDLVWIAGSTQAPEEQIVLDIYCRLRARHPRLHLVVVPRQKDRFDEVAQLLKHSGLPVIRRSELRQPLQERGAIVLLDSMGELGALWGLADVAFVGGSLDGRRGGQNMIEPSAYGAAVVFGPHVWNFRDIAARLVAAGAAKQVAGTAELETAVLELLENSGQRQVLGQAARWFVIEQQGATERTVALLGGLLQSGDTRRRVA
jgi:3-deoxy-D-manno-octulosonic-acid transferase